jgi:branched-chain amino acid transport system permease protein
VNGRPNRPGECLEAVNVSMSFGGVHALRDVSLRVEPGKIVGLIGPNGSGKTTMLNCISGVIRPSSGSTKIGNKPLAGRSMHAVAASGIVRTFQNIRLFSRLTASDNVLVAALASHSRRDAEALSGALLEEFGIAHLANHYANELAYGDQRRLEIARALGTDPKFLLLDEPAAGMNEIESARLGEAIQIIQAERGCGILLVEHDLGLILKRCDYVYVLNEGRLISEGAPKEVSADPAVVAAYIGAEEAPDADGPGFASGHSSG